MIGGLLGVKLRRDLRATWPRFVLMTAAVAVSLTMFSGTLLAWATVSREVDAAYRGTEPASATIVLDEHIDADELAQIAAEASNQPGIVTAAARSIFGSDVQVNGEDRTIPLQLIVATPDDDMSVARFGMQPGTWPPSPSQIYLRADSLALLDAQIGDTITLTPSGGEPVQLTIAGTVYDPSLAPSPQEQRGYGYLSTAALGPAATLDQIKIEVADTTGQSVTSDRDQIVSVANDLGQWLQDEHGIVVREIQVPPPFAHPHQSQADALLLSLLGGSAAALLLGALLVATMLNNLFMQQIPQIGMMKAIGARSGNVARLYLTMTLLIAGIATLIATPLAVLIGRAGTGALTGFLGVEPASLTAPWWAILTTIAVGLAIPPLLALLPLIRASRTTVRKAIDHSGAVAPTGKSRGLLTGSAGRGRLSRALMMTARNAARRPGRLVLSVGLLAVAGGVFIAGLSLNASTQAVDDERIAERTWDVEVQLAGPAPAAEVVATAEQVPGVTSVSTLYRMQTSIAAPGELPVTRTYPDQGHGSVSLTAVTDPATDPGFPPTIIDGRWLTPGETGSVVLNQVARNNLGTSIGAGDTVALLIAGESYPFTVVGIAEEREGGSGNVYTTAEALAEATGQPIQANMLRIETAEHDEQARQSIAEATSTALTQDGITVQTAASVSRSDAISAGHLGPVLLILLGVAVPLGVIGTIGLAATMSANVLERTRELGIMKAIGATPRSIRRMVVSEGLLVAGISLLVAIPIALALSAILGDGLGTLFMSAPLPFRISPVAIAIWIGLTTLGAVLATDAAANRASRLTIRDAITQL
ncbi:MAG: FtsX-like permease family protein [Propionicimonas sp.]